MDLQLRGSSSSLPAIAMNPDTTASLVQVAEKLADHQIESRTENNLINGNTTQAAGTDGNEQPQQQPGSTDIMRQVGSNADGNSEEAYPDEAVISNVSDSVESSSRNDSTASLESDQSTTTTQSQTMTTTQPVGIPKSPAAQREETDETEPNTPGNEMPTLSSGQVSKEGTPSAPNPIDPRRRRWLEALLNPKKPQKEDDENESHETRIRERGPPKTTEFTKKDRYVCFNEELGSGAYKTVYKGMDTEESMEVAWNEMKTHKLSNRELARLKEEIKLLGKLKHDHIVKFYDSWIKSNNRQIFITELMTSGTLKMFLKNTGTPKSKVLQSWCKQILLGLRYLHEKNIIHRDIKCDNIFIDGTKGAVKIGDLGLATTFNKNKPKTSVIGTPEFMAPEMYSENYTSSVDIWAFGMTVLEMLTLEYPYSECTNAAQIFRKVTNGMKPAAFGRLSENNTIRREFILRCIAFKPEDRATARELLNDPFFFGVAHNAQDTPFDRLQTVCDVKQVHPDGSVDMVLTKVEKQTVVEAENNEEDKAKKTEKKQARHNIEFRVRINDEDDGPEPIANNMIEEGLIARADKAELTKLITSALRVADREYETIKAEEENAESEEDEEEEEEEEEEEQMDEEEEEAEEYDELHDGGEGEGDSGDVAHDGEVEEIAEALAQIDLAGSDATSTPRDQDAGNPTLENTVDATSVLGSPPARNDESFPHLTDAWYDIEQGGDWEEIRGYVESLIVQRMDLEKRLVAETLRREAAERKKKLNTAAEDCLAKWESERSGSTNKLVGLAGMKSPTLDRRSSSTVGIRK